MVLAGAAFFLVLSCAAVDPAKRYPNMVANVDPISAGTIEASFDRTFSAALNVAEVEAIFYPRLNSVALQFKHELVTYRQFWDAAARLQFAQSLERYKTDYAARSLVDRYTRTRAIYGSIRGHLEWQTFSISTIRVGYPTIEIGYCFRNDSPFFTTLMRSAKEVETTGGDNVESQQISMYFTRAQADELVRFFDQSYLMGLIREQESTETEALPTVDDYYEQGN